MNIIICVAVVCEKAGFGIEFKKFIEFSIHIQNCAALSVRLDFLDSQKLCCNNTDGFWVLGVYRVR